MNIAGIELHVFTFRSAAAAEKAFHRTVDYWEKRDADIGILRSMGMGPLDGIHYIVAVGRDADRYSVMGGKYEPKPPVDLVQFCMARRAKLVAEGPPEGSRMLRKHYDQPMTPANMAGDLTPICGKQTVTRTATLTCALLADHEGDHEDPWKRVRWPRA